jgi:hypothetical protein
MCPSTAMDHRPDSRRGNPVSPCKIGLPDATRRIGRPNRANVILGDLRLRRLTAALYRLTSLRDAIAIVVQCRPKKEMIGAHAKPVIASMAGRQSIRDWAVGVGIGEAMGSRVLSPRRTKRPVTPSADRPLPLPAPARRLLYSLPEAHAGGGDTPLGPAGMATIFAVAVADSGGPGGEFLATLQADTLLTLPVVAMVAAALYRAEAHRSELDSIRFGVERIAARFAGAVGWARAILGGHDLSLLHRLRECHPPAGNDSAGALCWWPTAGTSPTALCSFPYTFRRSYSFGRIGHQPNYSTGRP